MNVQGHASTLVNDTAAEAAAFRRLGVRHYVGGSVASTVHGAIRSTMDVAIVCDLRADQIEPFLAAFGDEFYVSEPAVRLSAGARSHVASAATAGSPCRRGRPEPRPTSRALARS